jgi:N-acetylglucosaminyldiphosphoundecaprenol N-acetyl-beta-D-mannosaminyltransferase
MTHARVLDVDCFVGDLDSAAAAVIQRAASREGGVACLANAHVFVTARRNQNLMSVLRSSWAVFPDGAPVAWLLRRSGFPSAERVAGPDLMPTVLDRGRAHGLHHFLFGSTPAVVDALESQISRLYPGAEIVGRLAPQKGNEDATDVISKVRVADPHIVWVALGAPKQELWAQRHTPQLDRALLVPVGAAFDFVAGAKPRAPRWMQQRGLEWLHRLATEPRRLGWRYLSTNSVFLIRAIRQLAYHH